MDPQESVAEKWQIQEWQEFASRFRQLGAKFSAVMQPEQSLNVLREAVDDHLPWQAGRHLCQLFDYGLIDGTEIAGKRKSCELRVLSPVWREKEIERLTTRAKGARRLGGLNQEPPAPEYIKSLQEYHELCKSAPAGKQADLDSVVVRATWWRFILRDLTRSEDYKTRLGTKVEQNFGTLVGMLEDMAGDYSSAPLDDSPQFSDDSTEERLRLRLHTAARIQTVACEILAEILESKATIKSEWLTIEREEQQRQAANAAKSTSDAASDHHPKTQSSDTRETDTVSGPVLPDPPKSDRGFLFCPDGDGYFISAFEESGHFKSLLGFCDLFRLSQSPNVAVGMNLLVEESKQESRSRDDAVDSATLQEARRKLEDLTVQHAATSFELEKSEIQKEMDEVSEYLKSSTGLHSRPKNMNSTHLTKLRSKIHDRIETAIAKLRAAAPPMHKTADHFEQTVRSDGEGYIYAPGQDAPTWKTSKNSSCDDK